jgi:hypothetical protein
MPRGSAFYGYRIELPSGTSGKAIVKRNTDSSNIYSGNYYKTKTAAVKQAAKHNKLIKRVKNPYPSADGEWLACHGIRKLPTGEIQLLTEKGVLSNPARRKSFINKVKKLFSAK